MLAHERKRRRVKAGRKADAVNARVQRAEQAGLERFKPRIHRELFHHVHVNETLALLALHHASEIELRGLADLVDGKEKARLAHRLLNLLAGDGLHARKAGSEQAVGKVGNHRVRDVADPAASRNGLSHFGRRDVDAHAALHDRNKAAALEIETEVVKTKFVKAFHS